MCARRSSSARSFRHPSRGALIRGHSRIEYSPAGHAVGRRDDCGGVRGRGDRPRRARAGVGAGDAGGHARTCVRAAGPAGAGTRRDGARLRRVRVPGARAGGGDVVASVDCPGADRGRARAADCGGRRGTPLGGDDGRRGRRRASRRAGDAERADRRRQGDAPGGSSSSSRARSSWPREDPRAS